MENHLDPELSSELEQAREIFYNAALEDEQLPRLLLVDPIHALADAGVDLSARAREYIREMYPGRQYGNEELYERIRAGDARIPWVRNVRLRRMDDPPPAPPAQPRQGNG